MKAVAKERPKPFANCKPRAEWRRPVRRVKGRLVEEVCVGRDAKGEPEYALFEFTMTSAGVRVHRKRKGRKGDKVWTFQSLANGVAPGGQMRLFQ